MHVCCPQCGNSIELIDDSDFQSIDCPGCGSSFGLVDVDQAGIETLRTEHVESRVIGNFRLIVEVGRGAYGTVWRAHDIALDRPVAVKLPRQRHTSAADQEQFFREARSVAQLNHPNIVAVHEVGREEDQLFIVSDFVDGITLADKISADPFSQRAAVQLCVTIAGALSHAHDNGIVHRDLKPANIMLTGKDEPRVMDFGLAKRQAGEITMTMEGKVLGTPAYMPPEQARGEGFRVDGRGDIYSLGVILYELLTGELPFRGRTRMLLQQVINDEAPSPRKLNSSIPRDLETITLKCLQKDPAKRYQDGAALSADLACWLEDRPIQARPSTWMERSWRWCRRKPAVASLTVAVTISLLAGIVIASWFAFEANFERNVANKSRGKLEESVIELKEAKEAAEMDKVAALLSAKKEKEAREELVKAVAAAKEAKEAAEMDKVAALLSAKKEKEAKEDLVKAVAAAEAEKEKAFRATKAAIKAEQAAEMDRDLAVEAERRAEEKEKQVRRRAYQSDMLVAQRDWDNSNVRHLLELLDRYQDDEAVRGFEWHYWQRLCHAPKKVTTFRGHKDDVCCIAISPDGTRVASGSLDKTVKVWEMNSGKERLIFAAHNGAVRGVSFSPDGKWVVSAGDDKIVRLWDAETGEQSGTFQGEGHQKRVTSVVFSSTGLIASGSWDGDVRVWNSENDEQICSPLQHDYPVTSVAFSADERTLVSASIGARVTVWNLNEAPPKEKEQLVGYSDPVTNEASPFLSVVMSPDGTRIAAAGFDRNVRIWDAGAEKSAPVHLLEGHRSSVNSLAFSPDGKRLVTASDDQTVKVWDPVGGAELFTHKGHGDEVLGVVFDQGGKKILSASRDKTVKLWPAEKMEGLKTWIGHKSDVWSVAFSSDGTQIVTGSSDKTVKVWDWTEDEEFSLKFSLEGHDDFVTQVAFSRGGKSILSAGKDGKIILWDAMGSQIAEVPAHEGGVWGVAFSPDGKQVVSAGEDKRIRLWDTKTGQQLRKLEGHTDSVRCVAFSLDGKQVVSGGGGSDQLIKLWDAETGEELQTLEGHEGLVWSVAFSPDGKRVASSSADKTVRVWDVDTGAEPRTLRGHMAQVRSVSFDRQGRRILSASLDGTVKLWDAGSGLELLTLAEDAMGVCDAAISPDGKWVVAGNQAGILMLWDGQPQPAE